jgi:hypothetical protein
MKYGYLGIISVFLINDACLLLLIVCMEVHWIFSLGWCKVKVFAKIQMAPLSEL